MPPNMIGEMARVISCTAMPAAPGISVDSRVTTQLTSSQVRPIRASCSGARRYRENVSSNHWAPAEAGSLRISFMDIREGTGGAGRLPVAPIIPVLPPAGLKTAAPGGRSGATAGGPAVRR
ncbi:hypothetical protein G6F57_018926 [Rhizopus arrhizus]|nr:hypothetical protein G6F57_018926 [Rhizopus arrhizus]